MISLDNGNQSEPSKSKKKKKKSNYSQDAGRRLQDANHIWNWVMWKETKKSRELMEKKWRSIEGDYIETVYVCMCVYAIVSALALSIKSESGHAKCLRGVVANIQCACECVRVVLKGFFFIQKAKVWKFAKNF